MPDSGSAGAGFYRLWIEGHWALFEGAGAGPLWSRAEMLFAAWARFADSLAEIHEERHGGGRASPFDPAGWLRAAGEGGMADLMRWLEGPDFAGLFGEERRAIRGTGEWLAWLAALEQMKAVLGGAWLSAFRDFAEALGARCGEAETEPPRWPEVLRLWQGCAAARLDALYRSPAYLAATRDLVRAGTDLRRGLRERLERVADLVGLPTRRELEDLHRTVHHMRRELRALRAATGTGAAPEPRGRRAGGRAKSPRA